MKSLLKKIMVELDVMQSQIDQAAKEELPEHFERSKILRIHSILLRSFMLTTNLANRCVCLHTLRFMEVVSPNTKEPLWKSAVLRPGEIKVLALLANGRSTKEVATDLSISVKTVEAHRKALYDKLNFDSLAQLTKYAILKGLSSSEP